MSASPDRINEVLGIIQARADADGSAGAKSSIGDPAGTVVNVPNVGIEQRGQWWADLTDTFPMLIAGLLDALDAPPGVILPFVGNPSALPDGWFVADGANGTVDLSGYFLKQDTVGATGTVDTGSGPGTWYGVRWIQKVT